MSRLILFALLAVAPVFAQGLPPIVRMAADQAGCVDSRLLPKLPDCRIDNCERKESEHRDVPIGEDKNGEEVTTSIEGDTRAVMYECREGITPSKIVEEATLALKASGFEVPYKFVDKEASLTARKEETWLLLDAASRFYTLTEIKSAPPDFESATDASSLADMIEKYGHVPLYGVHFLAGRPDLSPESVLVLEEVATMLDDHPDWRLRVEGHTDNVGTKIANQTLSLKRAATVATWLVGKGVKRARLDPQGVGDTHPVASNETEAGRNKNRRIELVRINDVPAGAQ